MRAGGVWERNTGFDVEGTGALTAGETFTHQISTTALFKHAASGLWKTSELGDALSTVSMGVGTQITERIQLSVDLLDTFKSRPPAPAQRNDVALVTALTAKF
jgi:hypothetical protein